MGTHLESRPLPALGPVRNPVLEHRVRLFSLVPLVWKSNPKLQGGRGWCKTAGRARRGRRERPTQPDSEGVVMPARVMPVHWQVVSSYRRLTGRMPVGKTVTASEA